MNTEEFHFDEGMVDPLRAMADAAEADAAEGVTRFALKHGRSFLVAGSRGDILGSAEGFFCNDTRLLSRFVLRIGDRAPVLLGSALSGDVVYFEANLTNAAIRLPEGGELPQGSIHVNRLRFLWQDRMYERIAMTNYGQAAVELPLAFRVGADFRDIFEVRGMVRPARGEMLPPERGPHHVGFGYRGLDGEVRMLRLSFSEPVDATPSGDEIRLRLALPRGVRRMLYIEAGTERAAPDRVRHRTMRAAAHRAMKARRQRGASVQTSGPLFNDWLARTRADIALLSSDLGTGPYPVAGIPWFSTPFGRDGILTALSMLWLDPGLARGVLRFLASTQADATDAFADAEPGKILHEIRHGEMARLREVPFGRYYGGADTTPLFVHLAAEYARRTDDTRFINRLWPVLRRAVGWIEANRAADADGLVGYARASTSGLRNHGWKDSIDSVFHADGTLAEGRIRLVEVQGYAYLALTGMADMARRRGEAAYAAELDASADRLRRTVEERFWMDDRQFYALALDGDSRPCAVRTTNAGHLLWSGLPSPERGRAVAEALMQPDFLSGWGFRTVAIGEARFNPMAYHNGSVWPHDTAICAAGIVRYTHAETAARALARLFEASFHFGKSLPELFCGFARVPGEGPVAYPVACVPQAWASAAVFLLLQTTLGVQIDARGGEVRVVEPRLPAGIDQLSLRNLDVAGTPLQVDFVRTGEHVACTIDRPGTSSVRMLIHQVHA